MSLSHPESNNDKEHLEEDAEDHIVCKSKRHDTQERGSGTEHHGGANFSQCIRDTSIFRDIRILRRTENTLGAGLCHITESSEA